MKKRLFIALILFLMLIPTGIAQADKPLTFTTDYSFVFDPDSTPDSLGRYRTWAGTVEGTFEGDVFEGTIEWWMYPLPMMKATGQVNHFINARWVIYDGAEKVLEGVEFGSTTVRPGLNGKWRANGKVTFANSQFADLFGRQFHDGGEFTWVPMEGWGKLQIN